MTHASLFSGIGGPEVAAAMLGWTNAFHCEINPFGRAVLEYWFPNSVSYEDITKTDFKPWRGRIDVLTGGFPCQPFSYAGKRGGREDERYLWPQMLRAIDEIRPAWVVGENVAGLATMVEGGVLSEVGSSYTLFDEGDELHGYELEQTFTIERICKDLERLGYSVQPVLIPAAAVGAPHRRDRIFILAYDADANGGDDERGTGSDERESVCEGVQERDEVRLAGVADQLRSEVRGDSADTANVRLPRDINAGAEGKVCGEMEGQGDYPERIVSAKATSGGRLATDADGRGCPSRHKSRGVEGERCDDALASERGLETEWADGLSPLQRSSADPDCQGREESKFPGWEEDCPEDGAGMDDRVERSRRDGESADSVCERLEREDEPWSDEGGERMRVRGDAPGRRGEDNEGRDASDTSRGDLQDGGRLGGILGETEGERASGGLVYESQRCSEGLRPGERWASFPTVSPVHRGNDGIPIRLDNLSISFGKWRTESLKAYGNAIVPQVMYRIFSAIQEVNDDFSRK